MQRLLMLALMVLPRQIQSVSVSYTVPESASVNTQVGNIRQGCYEGSDSITGFTIFHGVGSGRRRIFKVNEQTGDVRVAAHIDREALCNSREICTLTFTVTPHGHKTECHVTVTVEDVNDCRPQWKESQIIVKFTENSLAGTERVLPMATDCDSPSNARITYTLLNVDSPFSLKSSAVRDAADTVNTPVLIAERILDAEECSVYNMTLIAVDSGRPTPLTGSVSVRVFVADTNDNSPKFLRHIFTPDSPVYEDVPVGEEILRLRASDSDSGKYGQIVYGFDPSDTSRNQANARKFLSVTQDGRILVRRHLDADTMDIKAFVFRVTARDSGSDEAYRLTATATVSVSVLDRIDEPPSIVVCFRPHGCVQSAGRPRLSENASVGSVIALVTVSDLDSGDRVECQVLPGIPGEIPPFRLLRSRLQQQQHHYQYKLLSAVKFDRESTDLVTFTIACADSAGHNVTSIHTIVIDDVNDSAPTPVAPAIFFAVEEDKTLSQLSGRLDSVVRDADVGDNARLSFRIDPSDTAAAALFSVASDTGVLTPLVSFDRETQSVYNLRVIASDRGKPQLSCTVTATVSIIDINDVTPVCSERQYRMSVTENSPARSRVGTVTAQDADQGGNGRVKYRFADHNAADAFAVHPDTGVITTSKQLDREQKSHYSLEILAIDQPKSAHPLTAICRVSITVNDVNDNPPAFRITPSHPAVFHVNRREPGHSIGQLIAEDADEVDGANLRYELLNAAQLHHLFSVDSATGLVLVNKALHSVSEQQFRLKVKVCDSGRPSHCSPVTEFGVRVTAGAAFHGEGQGGGGGGGRGGIEGLRVTNELVIGCLSVMFAVLGAATILVVCLIARRRRLGHGEAARAKRRQVMTETAPDVENADLKMISHSCELPPAYKDFVIEDDVNNYSLQMKATAQNRDPKYYTTAGHTSSLFYTPTGIDSNSSGHFQHSRKLKQQQHLQQQRQNEEDVKHEHEHQHQHYQSLGIVGCTAQQQPSDMHQYYEIRVHNSANDTAMSLQKHQKQKQQQQQQQQQQSLYTEASFV